MAKQSQQRHSEAWRPIIGWIWYRGRPYMVERPQRFVVEDQQGGRYGVVRYWLRKWPAHRYVACDIDEMLLKISHNPRDTVRGELYLGIAGANASK